MTRVTRAIKVKKGERAVAEKLKLAESQRNVKRTAKRRKLSRARPTRRLIVALDH